MSCPSNKYFRIGKRPADSIRCAIMAIARSGLHDALSRRAREPQKEKEPPIAIGGTSPKEETWR